VKVPLARPWQLFCRFSSINDFGRNTKSISASAPVPNRDPLTHHVTRPFFHSVTESAGMGQTVTFVKATDRDSGANGLVKYSFISPGNAPFIVDESTGEVRVSGVVDFETTEVRQGLDKCPAGQLWFASAAQPSFTPF
jgi:hypothetical protein